ncbi:MAG: pyridoxamine 5'-phosphate oxidase family protein [Clostridia bacterium]|nr:pyridoxamine 5'-phosphate oxidase family protein [Clostridia bacterium]
MFRALTRSHRALSREDSLHLLRTENRGVLSVVGDDGYPYGMPMNHWYNDRDGCIYFHCGKQHSHRLDALRRCPKVSFCVMNPGEARNGGWALTVKSVIVFGQIEILDDPVVAADISRPLCYKFTQDETYIQKEIQAFAHETLILKLTPAHISGKWVVES